MNVYIALHTVPDYSSGPPTFAGVSETLAGAAAILYPDRKDPAALFKVSGYNSNWNGPDGYGLIRLVEVQP